MPPVSRISSLKLALVADELTRSCLAYECNIVDIPAEGFHAVLAQSKPDVLLVESAWHGVNGSWKFKVASYPWYKFRSNRRMHALVAAARDLGIPTVFWNKEDGVHFSRFIDVAQCFDHVLTIDENCVDRYKAIKGAGASVGVMPFPVQPELHRFTGFDIQRQDANFVGSYSHHIHSDRRAWQDMAFSAALKSGLGLTIYDRNSDRPSNTYRYPQHPGMRVLKSVSHAQTAMVYKSHPACLNVNTVVDSATMYSRRLVEILACGGILVTSPAKSVDAMFKDYCHVVRDEQEGLELFSRLREGPSSQDLERARAGSEYVLKHHTWHQRLEQILDTVGL